MLIPLLIAAIVGYVLGSLPFGYLVARAHGVNIFEVGSRSSGATNVKRVLGARAGNLVFLLDVLKGMLAASGALGSRFALVLNYDLSEWGLAAAGSIAGGSWLGIGIAGLVGALLGHSFSLFTRFRGGKGVASGAGGFLMLAPAVALSAVAVWIVSFYLSRYVSLASILAALTLPVAALGFGSPGIITLFGVVVAGFVIVRHRANISRLLDGTESRFTRKPPEAQS